MKYKSKLAKIEKLLEKYSLLYEKKQTPEIKRKVDILSKAIKKISPKENESNSKITPKAMKKSQVEPTSSKEELPGTSILIQKGLFSELPLSEPVSKAIAGMKFEKMTEIQCKAIPYLLDRKDVMGCAKTGSGKTLAFLIPVVELLLKTPPLSGTGAIIISPVRELSLQTYGVLKELTAGTALRIGLVMGGTNRSEEVNQLAKGVTILVTTPGRLLDHLQRTDCFDVRHMSLLVLDEADRILDIGFEEDMKQILRLLPKKRQTMFFSATLNKKTFALAQAALKVNCLRISVSETSNRDATVEGLEQSYFVCPPDKRFCLLYTFLKRNQNKKIMVFMSACLQVKFYYELLNYIDISVSAIHGRQKQAKRTETFLKFCQSESGVLLCTDVAARGLDIPQVDWIFQYDPPDDSKEYIHRVGRTARAGASGSALLLLRPHEIEFLNILKQARVKVTQLEVSMTKIANVQDNLEKLVNQNYFLNKSAQEGYKGMVRSYASYGIDCFKIADLNLTACAKNFGLTVPPLVDLNVHSRNSGDAKSRRGRKFHRGSANMSQKKLHKTKIYKRIK